MKIFTDSEKNAIKYIIRTSDENGFVIANLFEDCFYKYKVRYSFDKKSLIFYRNIDSLELDDMLGLERFIIDRTFLVKYLIEQEYVIEVEDEHPKDYPKYLGNFDTQGLAPVEKKLSTEIAKLINDHSFKRAYISNKLIDLVNNDFLSLEQQMLEEAKLQTRNSKNTNTLSICMTVLAALTFASSIVMPICINKCHENCGQAENVSKSDNSFHGIDTVWYTEYIEEPLIIDTVKVYVPKYQVRDK
mgnify:CR=1 FL=1